MELCKLSPVKGPFNVIFFHPETVEVRLKLKEMNNHFTKSQSEWSSDLNTSWKKTVGLQWSFNLLCFIENEKICGNLL